MAGERERQFEDLAARHGASLRRLSSAYVDHDDAAEDLLQEILVAVWNALPSFRGDCSERTFVFRIAHNRALTFRSRRRQHVRLDDIDEIRDPQPDPAARLSARLERDRLLHAVRALPDALRRVVTLHLEGCSHDEIAGVLGITTNNVAVRLNRGRAALRSLLREQELAQ